MKNAMIGAPTAKSHGQKELEPMKKPIKKPPKNVKGGKK